MKSQFFVAIISILLLSACVAVQPVTVTDVNNFRVEDVLSGSPKISFDILIHNPNGYGLTLKEFKSTAFMNEKLITDIYLEKKIHIAANSDITIPLKSSPSIKDIISTYLSGHFNGDVRVDGYIIVSKFLFRKKFPFSLTTKL